MAWVLIAAASLIHHRRIRPWLGGFSASVKKRKEGTGDEHVDGAWVVLSSVRRPRLLLLRCARRCPPHSPAPRLLLFCFVIGEVVGGGGSQMLLEHLERHRWPRPTTQMAGVAR